MNQSSGNEGNSKTAIVIGGGIMGLASAYALGKEGVRVTVLDSNKPNVRASNATAGILGGSSVIPWASSRLWPRLPGHLLEREGPFRMAWPLPQGTASFFRHSVKAGRPDRRQVSATGLANLGLRGWDAWQELLLDLPQARAMLVQNGCLFYYATVEQRDGDSSSNKVRRSFGMNLTNLSAEEMKARLPPLMRAVAGGTCVTSAGHVLDPVGLQDILKAAILDQGAKYVERVATGFTKSGDSITSVIAGEHQYSADSYVIAAGIGGAKLSMECGRKVPMIPAWGASVTFLDAEIELNLPILSLGDGIALTPSRHGLRVSGLLQIGGVGKSEKMIATLISKAKEMFGDFSHSGLTSCAGARPLTADSLPLLGLDPKYQNLVHNYGHGHWGLTHAGLSGQVTTDLVTGKAPRIDINAYRPDRF